MLDTFYVPMPFIDGLNKMNIWTVTDGFRSMQILFCCFSRVIQFYLSESDRSEKYR